MYRRFIIACAMPTLATGAQAENEGLQEADSLLNGQELQEVTVASTSGVRRLGGALNAQSITQREMFRAACCNLGESFQTNPSVDVSYKDAATGVKQIKLLGLSGTYVQMLADNMPAFRTSALPFALGFVPGTWMKGIQVSKGSASVKNGYESVTGQINIDYLHPEDAPAANVNVYGDSEGRTEVNADASIKLTDKLTTIVMGHADKAWTGHDVNHDGFTDTPQARQLNIMNRWKYKGERYIFHGGWSALTERRTGGQDAGHMTHEQHQHSGELFTTAIDNTRYDAYMKHAFILDPERGTNIALMANSSMQLTNARFGHKLYDANTKNVYGQLLFDHYFNDKHALSAGTSINYDYLSQAYNNPTLLLADGSDMALQGTDARQHLRQRETTSGIYAQYTLTLGTKLTAMAGMRLDHSTLWGTFATPRVHLKWQPHDVVSVRLSAGKGYRTPFALAENLALMASGRTIEVEKLEQERAWNYGVSTALNIPLMGKTLKVNAEYYYTDFSQQMVVDYDSRPGYIMISQLAGGKSYSHTMQVDATYPFFRGFTLTAAYRLNDVRTTYGGELRTKPLTSKYKALATASYETPLRKWQFDVTVQINGGGRLPDSYTLSNGQPAYGQNSYNAFEQLSAQVTREFRTFSIYVGGENLTGFRQKNPVLDPSNPWSPTFEPTIVWGPVHGAMAYAGIRFKIK